MPELPDVEAVIGRIRREVLGRRITEVAVLDRALADEEELEAVVGRSIEGLARRGKYILFSLSGGLTVVLHLRMTGNLLVSSPETERPAYTRLTIHLEGERELRFVDRRRLGVLYLIQDMDLSGIPGLRRMGPEPLSAEFTLPVFAGMLSGRRAMIKSLLLDQRFIAGIGNVYGDEILFQSGIRPTRRASDLTAAEVRRLYQTIRRVLRTACEHKADLSVLEDWFVHGRRRGRCTNCDGRLSRVKIQGRYSYYCGRCQR